MVEGDDSTFIDPLCRQLAGEVETVLQVLNG